MSPETLKLLMDERKLNTKKLAGLLSVNVRSVCHWLNGSRKITKSRWEHILLVVSKPKKMNISGSEWNIE
jgi:DNA-binding transcriptional regulator YiaG